MSNMHQPHLPPSPPPHQDRIPHLKETTINSSPSAEIEESTDNVPPDPILMRQIYHKLDLRIIPPFWLLYFLCSAVRSTVGLAQTMNLSNAHDLGTYLHLTPHQISTGLALFYVTYVILEVPSNLAMSKLSPSVWLARIVVSVGIIGTNPPPHRLNSCYEGVKWMSFQRRSPAAPRS